MCFFSPLLYTKYNYFEQHKERLSWPLPLKTPPLQQVGSNTAKIMQIKRGNFHILEPHVYVCADMAFFVYRDTAAVCCF